MSDNHFDSLQDYDAEIPEHMRQHYLQKKNGITKAWIERYLSDDVESILDVGCGTGWHLAGLASGKRRLVGLDSSKKQLSKISLHLPNIEAVHGSAERLPFADQSFNVVLAINTIHHLPDVSSQQQALREIYRVLKVGGIFVIHEVNIINPVIRFYMNFLFPKLRKIDIGNEIWLQVSTISKILGRPVEEKYYTFIPDWAPRICLNLLRPIESCIEKTPLSILGAHFSAAFQKS